MISIQQIQYIIALSEELHFQKAADKCYVTQPTLSMQIKKAEEVLGGLVFDRSRNPIQLTAFGLSMLPILRDTINEYNKIESLSLKRRGIHKEELKIAIIPTISNYLLPDLFENWRKIFKDVHIIVLEMKTEEILSAIENKKIDVGILAGPIEKYPSTLLFNEEIKAYLPNRKGVSINLNDLADEHPWLLTKGNCLRTQMINFCQLNDDLNSDWDYEGGNMSLLERMVKLYGGYTLIPVNNIVSNDHDYKSIVSGSNQSPARSIVGITQNKSVKMEVIQKVFKSIQKAYTQDLERELKILNWNV
jgi:LysR family hydrogen peroxide-inducible transcriptional activator